MEKERLESRNQLGALQEELASSRQRNSELEREVDEFKRQVVSLRGQIASHDTQLAMLRGEQDAIFADGFVSGVKEIRAKLAQERPDWDLSFLEMESFCAQTPGAEASAEIEWEDISDIDLDAALETGAAVDSVRDGERGEDHPGDGVPDAQRLGTFEVGGPSYVSPAPAAGSPELGPEP